MTRIIGLTGGIGSGKWTVANYIASKGIPVYIADEEAKKLMDSKVIIKKIQAIRNSLFSKPYQSNLPKSQNKNRIPRKVSLQITNYLLIFQSL